MGALLRARTKSKYGGEPVGTFDNNTVVSGQDADLMIQQAVEEIALNIGADLPDALGSDKDAIRKSARAVAELLAAMNIEMSLFPEAVERGLSVYQALERRYNRLFPKLVDAIAEAGGQVSGEDGNGGTSHVKPSYDFGDHEGTTLDERW